MKDKKQFNQIYSSYCCLDLLRAKESGFVDEVVSGIYFANDSNCKKGIPKLHYCPFCGAEIITIALESGWDWDTNPRPVTV